MFFLVIVLIGAVSTSTAQVLTERQKELKRKYQDGSIYVPYYPLIDIIVIATTADRVERIRARYGVQVPPPFRTFCEEAKTTSQRPGERTAVSVLQLDFVSGKAGVLKAGDTRGTPSPLNWTPEVVMQVTDWCDLFLTLGSEFYKVYNKMLYSGVSLKEAWTYITKTDDDTFMRETDIAAYLVRFTQMFPTRTAELNDLKGSDEKLHSTFMTIAKIVDEATKKGVALATASNSRVLRLQANREPNADTSFYEFKRDPMSVEWSPGSLEISTLQLLILQDVYQEYKQMSKTLTK
jgi:hypothetical protein